MKTIRSMSRPALLGVALLAGPVQVEAATLGYDLSGSIDFGALLGEVFSGSFSFDDGALTGTGAESLPLTAMTFTFHGRIFSGSDAAAAPTAEFQNGSFLGLSYSVAAFDPSFSLIAAVADDSGAYIDNPYLAYTPASGVAGFGSITYTPTAVPLPGAAWLLVSALPAVAGAAWRGRGWKKPQR